jgi:DMSO/TMAO reductase YedYZ molybdopterin-dependent catalytic subunit
MKTPKSPPDEQDLELRRQLGRMTRRGFAIGGVAALAGFGGWKWLGSRTEVGRVRWPLRRILELDETVARSTFNPARLSKTFPASQARMPRTNGWAGINENIDLAAWRMAIEGPSGKNSWSIADVKSLPRFEVTTELRCIEGWSEVVTWAGARLVDMADPADLVPYVSLTTPDTKYFVGLDVASAFHPQTLLCYEMNGEPLTVPHGAPLRLAIPVKYGIKSLKQIGSITFTDVRPADYWATKGYDWYAGF